MMVRGRLLPALLAAGGLLAGPAQAAPTTGLLESTNAPGAADCPGTDALAATVNDGLGRAALLPASATAPGAALRVVVRFERAAKGYAATVDIGGGRGGTRKLADRGPGCGALGNAVGVLLVVLLDSNTEPSVDGGPAASPPGNVRDATLGSRGGPNGGTVRATTADVGVGAGVAQGLVGGWSPALGLGGTLAYRQWSARLGGLWLPDRSTAYGPGRVEVGLALARLALCASTQAGRAGLTLGLCAQQQLGWISGRGIDYGDNHAASQLWMAAGASIVASGPLGPTVGWEVESGVVRLLREQRFVIGNLGTAFQSQPWAFVTTLGVTTRVW